MNDIDDDEVSNCDETFVEKKVVRKRIPLRSLAQVRKYLARCIREFEADPRRAEKVQEYRARGFLANALVAAFAAEKVEALEARLTFLEKQTTEAKDAQRN